MHVPAPSFITPAQFFMWMPGQQSNSLQNRAGGTAGPGGLGADTCPYFGRSNNLISIWEQILSPPPIFRTSAIPASSRIKQESMAPMLNNYWTLASCTALCTTTDYGHPVRKLTSLHGRKSTPNSTFLGRAEGYFVCQIGPDFFGCL